MKLLNHSISLLHIVKKLSSNCSIKSITLNNEGLTLVKKDPYTYTVTIDKNTKQLDLSIELSDSKATIPNSRKRVITR